nr:aminopeptidase Ey [Bactrocera oleae]
MNILITTFLLLLGCSAAIIDATEVSYRLARNVMPVAYDIWLRPYLLVSDGARRYTFNGEVNITLHYSKAQEITLHKNLIEITGAWLYNNNNKSAQLIQTFTKDELTFDDITQKLTVPLKDQLTQYNKYILRFMYTGQIRDGMQGFFRANYTDDTGLEKWIGVTQSQRIDARSIFPCFDEPAFKATFRLEMSRPAKYKTVFNTELLESIPDGADRYLDIFAATPPMSTYLFAFLLSEHEQYGSDDLKVITRAEYQNYTLFAYEVAERAIKAYDEYTRQPYKQLGLPLMQLAGSPKFPHNGMENWGLIIYKDDVLVNQPGYTDGWSNKEYTLTIIVHETAHMWFGNSVTMEWWSYFWLNEGFARYYQYFLANKLYPEYQLDQQFVVNQIHLIFEIDATNATQPMTSLATSINTPQEIGHKFSSIAYAKGAAILRMMANLMGVNNFDNAIRAYLKEYHLKNTKPEYLFEHLKNYWPSLPQVHLEQFFSDWTEQVGYPVLFVNVIAVGRINLTQKRFLLDPRDAKTDILTYTIPLTYTTDNERQFDNLTARIYIQKDSDLSLIFDKPYKWILFNLQQSNYYRVFYDKTLLWQLKTALSTRNHSGIPIINRAQLIDDLFNFARVGMLGYDKVFEFTEYLTYETEYLPWYAFFSNLQRVAQRLTLEQQKLFVKYLQDIMSNIYKHLGFTRSNDTVLDIYNRNKVISWACKYHLFECDREAQQHFDALKATGSKPTPDFRETLYCNAIRDSQLTYYGILNEWFRNEKVISEKQKLMRAMSCTRFFHETQYIRILSGDIPSEYTSMSITEMYKQNPENVEAILIMITTTIDHLVVRIGGWSNLANLIHDIANYLTTPKQQKLLEDFVEAHSLHFGSSISILHDAVANVETNLKWANMHLPKLLQYLERRNGAGLKSITALLLIFVSVVHRFL